MDDRELLKEHGLKATNARREVLRVLSSFSSPVGAEEVFRSLLDKGIDLSTVYRTLNSFVDAELAKREVGPHKENLYSLLGEEDHHLLVCLKCGKKIPLEGCPYHEANEAIEKATGFKVHDHNTEIYGYCPDCQKAK